MSKWFQRKPKGYNRCGYCNGNGKVRSAQNPRKKIKCLKCNGTGEASIDQTVQLLKARNKGLNRCYCPLHGAYQGSHCPDTSHQSR